MRKNEQNHAHKNFVPANTFKEGLGRLIFKLMGGWKVEGTVPAVDKCIIIVAHHTSNWDFAVGIACKMVLRLRLRFFAKHSLFIPPLGWLMKALGGVPIKRDKARNQVETYAEEIRNADNFVLVITPEGTRSKVQRWKTGFYHIARKADIPIIPTAFDFEHRRIVFGDPIYMSGEQDKDFETMHRYFLPYQPKHPELGCNGPFENQTP